MKRIDTLNARPDLFGVGKAGFSDNADLPGQDATYLSPEWLNMMQEELCNLLELHGIALNPESKRQLYDLLTTQTDLEALADEIETNFIRKNNIVDNLTTDDAAKPVSAKQAKNLQDNKLDKSGGTLTGSLTTVHPITVYTGGAFQKLIQGFSSTDGGYIAVGNNGEDKGYLELGTTDDADTAIYVRKRRSLDNSILHEAALLDSDGNTSFPNRVNISSAIGGGCGLGAGNQDSASYDGCNIDLNTWWGFGIKSTADGIRRIVFDARSGDISTRGAVHASGLHVSGNVNFALGVGQTWQDMTASRALNTTYTNSTGKPIEVSIYEDGIDGFIELHINGVVMAMGGNRAQGAANDQITVSAIIPNGTTYKLATKTQNYSYIRWFELR